MSNFKQEWKKIVEKRISQKTTEFKIGKVAVKKNLVYVLDDFAHLEGLIDYCVNTYQHVWDIERVRSFFAVKTGNEGSFENLWLKTIADFVDLFSPKEYKLKNLTKSSLKSNMEKALIFVKTPRKGFNIDVAGLLAFIFKEKYIVTMHETLSFWESKPHADYNVAEDFFEKKKRGILDIVLEKRYWNTQIKALVKFYDKLLGKFADKCQKVNVLLKTESYVTQWHYDFQETPSIVIFHQLCGSSLFLGLTGAVGYYFLAKGQNEQMTEEDTIKHFKYLRGEINGDTVLRNNRKEIVLVEEGDTIVIFPSGMHQVHVPNNVTKSIAMVLQYTLKDLQAAVRKRGYYHEYELEQPRKKQNK